MDLYQRYGRALLRKAERMLRSRADAEDVVHALFVDLLEKRDAVVDLPYLYRAVTNRCLALLRDASNRARLLERNDVALRGPARTPLDDQVLDLAFVVTLVRELDERDAEVLAYHFLDDMGQEEIADLLGVSRKTVGHRIAAVRDAAKRLAGQNASEPATREEDPS